VNISAIIVAPFQGFNSGEKETRRVGTIIEIRLLPNMNPVRGDTMRIIIIVMKKLYMVLGPRLFLTA
jgi:hypothetical protein